MANTCAFQATKQKTTKIYVDVDYATDATVACTRPSNSSIHSLFLPLISTLFFAALVLSSFYPPTFFAIVVSLPLTFSVWASQAVEWASRHADCFPVAQVAPCTEPI